MALTKQQEAEIQKYKDDYAKAKAEGNYDAMRTANENANKVRESAGVQTYDSSKGDLQYAQNRNLDTTRTPQTATQAYNNKYTGPQFVVRDGLNVDMYTDYQDRVNKSLTPQEKKLNEEYRNAKLDIYDELGLNTYGGKTYNYADVSYSDYDESPYKAYADRQNALMGNDISAAEKNANTTLAQLEAQANALGLQTTDELRKLWTESQLDQKALTEALAAKGITGGGAESARLGLDTAYREGYLNEVDNFNNSKAALMQKMAGVQTDLATTINAIRTAYGTAVANAYYQNLQQKAEAESVAKDALIKQLGY